MLLNFLRWLTTNADLDFSVVLIRGGDLAAEFAEIASVTYALGSPNARAARRMLQRLGWGDDVLEPPRNDTSSIERAIRLAAQRAVRRSLRDQLYRPSPPDLVYLNTVGSGSVLSLVSDETPVVTHVHELAFQLRWQRYCEPSAIEQVLARTRRYIAVSQGVAEALSRVYGIDSALIDLCHEFIPIADIPVEPSRISAAREQLGIAPDTLLVGSVGAVEWRKGTDLFLQVAKRVLEVSPRHVMFVWVGSAHEYFWEEAMRHDLESLGLAERVRFVGAVPDPTPIVAAIDVFVLPSRSDAFPLACLEAAAQGKPTICFDAGGITEFLTPDDRLVVPYLDVDAMAERIRELLASPVERQALGERLALRVRERHRLESSAPVLLGYIERMLHRHQSNGN